MGTESPPRSTRRRERLLLERVLVPLDGSEVAQRILTHVSRLLCSPDTEVLLVRVVAPDGRVRPGDPPLDQAVAELETARQELAARGSKVGLRVLAGEPVVELQRLARTYEPSLVCLSFNGRTGLRGTRGRVAEGLLRCASAPLLVANPFEFERTEALRIRHVLFPFDGSETSAALLPLAAAVASRYGAKLMVLHVVELPGQRAPTTSLSLDPLEESALLEVYRVRFGLTGVRLRVVLGSAADAILEVAKHEQIDLLAIATHSAPRGSTSPFGTVSDAVIRQCPCPLLVMRTGVHADPPAGAPHVLCAID